jgi:hypothetical protein
MEDDNTLELEMVMDFIDQSDELRDIICNRLYIVRNISLSVEGVENCLKEIDNIFRDKDNFN